MLNSRFLKKYRYNDTLLSLKWNMFPNGATHPIEKLEKLLEDFSEGQADL